MSAALTGGMGSGAQDFGGGWCRLFVAVQISLQSDLLWNYICKCFPPPPETGMDGQLSAVETGLILLKEKDGLVQVLRCVLGSHGEIKFLKVLV